MIGWLEGTIVEKYENTIVLGVQGVGYELIVGEVLANSVSVEQDITLFTHLIVKQDAMELYGFQSAFVRNLFRKLMQVSGVGGKNALSIVATLRGSEIIESIQFNDPKTLTRAPGIGSRVATRIVNDLEGKLNDLPVSEGLPESQDMKTKQDAMQALVSLGYSARESSEAVNGAWVSGISVEELIRRALQRLNIN